MRRLKPGLSSTIPSDVRGRKYERMYRVIYQVSAEKASVANPAGIHAAVTDNGAPQIITTGITQLSVPRNVTATAGGTAASIKAIQVVVTGTNYADEPITETLPAFTVDTAGTVVGNKAFKTITSFTIPAHDAITATTALGFGEKLGLPYKLPFNTVDKAFLDSVKEGTPPTVTTSATDIESNTIDLATALSGKVVDILLDV